MAERDPEDLSLPYLGVKHTLGEITEDELEVLAARVRPTRRAPRYFDQVAWDERGHSTFARRSRSGRAASEHRDLVLSLIAEGGDRFGYSLTRL